MEPELSVVVAAVGLPFLGAVATPVLFRVVDERMGYVGAAIAVSSFGLLLTQVNRQGPIALPWVRSLDVGLRFAVDGWSLLFALLASGIGVLVFTYSVRYMQGERALARYYAILLAFMGSILGVALAADLIALFLFWELTSLCSFGLIGHHTEDPQARYAARMALIVTVGGGFALLVGLLILASVSEAALGARTFDLTVMLANHGSMRTELHDTRLFLPALTLFAGAAAAKSAQVPLHFWLPNAMVAPTPVSAFLHSATMVKVGVYFIGRIRPLFLGEPWTVLIASLGLATMLVGALLAVVSNDTKELLAYSTASHLGLMVAGFGFGVAAGGEAGVFHLLNHALFKAPLFLVAGIIVHEAGTRQLDELGGLWRDLPVTAVIAVVASLSMAGVPPFNGFYSKELLFEASYETASAAGGFAWLYPIVAVVASVLTVLYSLRFMAIFFGERRAPIAVVHRPSHALVGPPAVLVGAVLVVSLAPQLTVDSVVQGAVEATALHRPVLTVGLPDHVTAPLAMSGVAIVLGVAAFPFADRLGEIITGFLGFRAPIRPSWWYDRLLSVTETASGRVGPLMHNGLLRTYVSWGIATASVVVLVGYAVTAGIAPTVTTPYVPTVIVLVVAIAVFAAAVLATARSHVAGVLSLSILGFTVAIFFILASAPDLALTQLVVETLVLLIFLLVLEKLPSYYADVEPFVLLRDAGLSILVGTMAFASVLFSVRGPDAGQTEIAQYYATEAIPGAGGANVVNVVIVDFRGLDTLGELFVIVIAAVSVLVLVTMRDRGEQE